MIVSYFMWSKIFIFAMLTVPKTPWATKIHENFGERCFRNGNPSGVFPSEGRSSSHPWHWSSSGAWDRLAPRVDLHLCTGSRSKMNIGTVCHPLDPWSWLEALVHHHPKGTPQASDCWLVRSSHSTATWDHPLPPSPLFFPACTSEWCHQYQWTSHLQPWHYL